jgi:two-component system cell cycle sensor histidine kinase/response regulator CckA
VLIVDDEPTVRAFVERALRAAGFPAQAAVDGPEALEVFEKQGPFQLLVTDMMMPLMKGDELARRLRQVQPSLKVLYLTGYTDRLFRTKTVLWQDEAFLEKPCSVRGLVEACELLLFQHIRPSEPPPA